jgi:hypothetical protein
LAKNPNFQCSDNGLRPASRRLIIIRKGERSMINSIVGQNLQWAQLAALQSPTPTQSGQNDGLAFNNPGAIAADPSVVNPVAGGTSPALSNSTSLMLMILGGGLAPDSGSTTGTGSAGGTGAATQTVGSPDDIPTPDGPSLASMFANLQPLVATLTAGASGGSSGASPASDPILQDLDNVFSNTGTLVASTNATQAPPASSNDALGNQPGGDTDITTPGSNVDYASFGDGPGGAGGGWQQQFAMAAYEFGGGLGLGSASASALQGISV